MPRTGRLTRPQSQGERNHVGDSSIKYNLARTPDRARLGRPAASSLASQEIDARTPRRPSPAVPDHLDRQQPGDTGTGSGTSGDLPYVITQADKTPGDNTINFAVTGTITLTSALPDLSNTTGVTDIEGPGATSLTVASGSTMGTAEFGVFTVDPFVTASLTGLTISGGIATDGGGIYNAGTLMVTNSTIADNLGLRRRRYLQQRAR